MNPTNPTSKPDAGIPPRTVPIYGTLEGFPEVDLDGGVDLTQLEPLTQLTVSTDNTRYEISLLRPSEHVALVCGGTRLPEPTEVLVLGSSFGGNTLKLGWICIGMHMELWRNQRHIVTSRVRSIEVLDQGPSRRLF
jgi:hypothetical protein